MNQLLQLDFRLKPNLLSYSNDIKPTHQSNGRTGSIATGTYFKGHGGSPLHKASHRSRSQCEIRTQYYVLQLNVASLSFTLTCS